MTDATNPYSGPDRRSEDRQQFSRDVALAIQQHLTVLSDDEVHWIKLAIKKEAQSISLRQAIIEKTLGGLVWAGLVGLGYIILDYMKAHGFK
jgi:hypothetical protein